MRVEALQRKIKYFLPSGECVLLVPGIPVPLPESTVRDLRHKAPAHITVHFDTWQETWHDDQAPLQPGFFIIFRYDGLLRGGPADGAWGQIVKVVRHKGEWKFFTGKGLIVSESLVRGVRAIHAHGHLLGAWLTKEHGLDGTKTRESRTPLADLSAEQRAEVMIRFNWSRDVFEAFATGAWPPALWTAVWGNALPITAIMATDLAAVAGVEATASATLSTPEPRLPTLRGRITLDTMTGLHDVSAWMIGDGLAVHQSWAVQGWTITHCASGKKLWSRLASKDVALDAAQRLFRLPGCDWTEASSLAGAREAILAVLQPLPLYRSKKTRAPPRAPPI
jgi:hypothetical protein